MLYYTYMPTLTKTCTQCAETKPIAKFTVDKRNKSGRGSWCYVCVRKYQLANGNKVVVLEQRCSKCRQILPIDQFAKSKSTVNGHQCTCRQCCSQDSVRYRSSEKRKQTIAKMAASVKVIPDSKSCTVCKEIKPASEFYKTKYTANGLASACKGCTIRYSQKPHVKQAIRERVKTHRAANVDKYRQREKEYRDKRQQTPEGRRSIKHSRIQHLYGLTIDQYEQMRAEQNGQCLLCLTVPTKDLVVDHCHVSGVVRGLLCNRCNLQLGPLEKDPQKTQRILAYLYNLVIELS